MGTHPGLSYRSVAVAALLGLAAWAPFISAATFTVGTGPNCTHSNVNDAYVATEGSAGPDTIRVTRSASYTQQVLSFLHVTQEVTITGGYADCTTNVEDATYTTLDGSGGDHYTVMTITGETGSIVHLRKLTISGGDINDLNSILGGGIYYTGNGLLDIADSSIINNTGAYGGGINAGGTGDTAKLLIGANTTIFGNTAYYNGGGIFSNNIEADIREDNTIIDFNTATGVSVGGGPISGGYGGGIHVRGCLRDTNLYLGSPGVGSLGVVYANNARYGGGVAVEGGQGCEQENISTQLRMFSTNPARLTKIQANNASVAGGALFLQPEANISGYVRAEAYVWDASIEENTAPDASVAYLNGDSSIGGYAVYSAMYFNVGGAPSGAIACAFGVSCGRISGNGASGSGRVMYGSEYNNFVASRIEISGNQGSELIRMRLANINNSVISGNTTAARLIEANDLKLIGSTIVGNTIGGAQVLGVNTGGDTTIKTTIVWQPGKLTLHNDGHTPLVLDVLSSDISTLTGSMSARLIVADPRFVDSVHGDYSLTAASEAVDFGPSDGSNPHDLYGHNRDLDFDLFYNDYGPRDLGALERETVQPLVLNSTFDANVYLWPEVTVGASNWDGTQNAPGTPAGGALHVSTTGSSISARKQCIHVPGPGTYTLNGWGKSTGTITPGSYVRLAWEYRSAGSETCTGTPTSSGNLLLANNGTWRKPPTPATIVVTDFAWTTDSSILVYLVVDDGGGIGGQPEAPTATLNGWFDGITLDVLVDRIFANGFD